MSLDNAGLGTHNAYGLYINSITGADTNYQLYSAGTANSYFAGNLGINTTSPSSRLTVVETSNSTTRGITNYQYSDDATAPLIATFKARGSVNTPTRY